ncbi:MAG: efflux RND transporter periplasmic adaptor subunit [Candidatus Erginobacter occultus]|nr:efflux RND transporter periplasmic adaptor subunit [Candidatus Erginobacter occultus]
MNDKIRINVRPRTRVLVVLLSLAVVAGAFLAARWLIRTAPRPTLREPAERSYLARTVTLAPGRERTEILSSGTVLPALRVELKPRVAGRVIRVSPAFRPGGTFAEGDEILALDPEDYRLALTERQADLVRVEAEYRIELGRQDIARREWELLGPGEEGEELDGELALRLPQLKQAEAAREAARAAVRRAELNLERTSVVAPFNAAVISKAVDPGAEVATSTVLGVLAGTDQYWVRLTLPVEELDWFESGKGDEGSPVLLRPAGGGAGEDSWTGRVIEKETALVEEGRLARVLVSVDRPLEERPLLLGMYLEAVIEGREVDGVFSLPRAALRDDDRVWLKDGEGRLEIREVEVIRSGPERVLIGEGLAEGEVLVVSDLAAPVPGILLRPIDDQPGEPSL